MTLKIDRPLRNAIVGDNVLLRVPTSKDCAEFTALNRSSRRFHRGLVSPPITPEQFAAFLQRSNTAASICVFVCLVTDGSIIGAISLSQIFRAGFQNAYLGYYVGAQYAGQESQARSKRSHGSNSLWAEHHLGAANSGG